MRIAARWGLIGTVLAIGVYTQFVRPWALTWGATPEEVARRLPGDDLVPRPMFDATRAITIRAAPEQVWPWLVQAGVTRAGWYSYDLLDNLGHHSAQRIVPELQHLEPGGIVPMSPDGKQGIAVHSVAAPHSMVWCSPGETSWTRQLDARTDGTTRLITRIRSRMRADPRSIAFYAAVELADVWMIRKMLLTLRQRAERECDRVRDAAPVAAPASTGPRPLHGSSQHVAAGSTS